MQRRAAIGDSGRSPRYALWLQPDFVKLWGGQTVSLLGDQVSELALPLVAILLLRAGAMDIGLLAAARGAPLLILGLLAGAWTDRFRRRPILIAADLGRAMFLASIPLAAVLGVLSMSWLYAAAIVNGIFSVFFNVAYQSLLPTIVQRGDLVEANAKLTVTRSIAGIAGPGLAGAAVQFLTAPVAIILDATSFVVSALCIGLIRHPESTPGPLDQPQKHQNVLRSVGDGLHFVRTQPLLRASAGTAGTYNFFNTAFQTLYILFLARNFGIAPTSLGTLLALAGPGTLLGALIAVKTGRRFGLGPTMIGGIALAGLSNLFVPVAYLVRSEFLLSLGVLALASFLNGFGQPFYNINQVSLR